MRILFGTIIISSLLFVSIFAQSKGSSIVIHDNTSQANGGENATSNLRSELESALANEKPCVDTMDDQDIRDVLQGERDNNTLNENSDPAQVLKDLGTLMGASYAMSVSATPSASGSTTYTVFVIDQSGKTVARETGTNAKQIADSIVKQLGSRLSDNCQPHWLGTINYDYINSETKVTEDEGATRAMARNVKRTNTQTMSLQSMVKATLMPPKSGANSSASKTMARVWMRTKSEITKKSETSGETLCRLPKRNPFWKGFSESYSETVTQYGGGAESLPVFITFDNDGNYRIVVATPSVVTLGKVETNRKATNCGDEPPPPTNDAQSMPEEKTAAGSFEVDGKTNAKNRDSLIGSKTLPDGKTKISWNLRLVKPKGK